MRVLVFGSTGLIGSDVVLSLKDRGHDVVRLVRSEAQLTKGDLLWDPEHHEIKLENFEGFDVVINLAGENIASARWNDEKKKKIKESRILTTHMLSELLARLATPPRLLINASAIGYYGDRGGEILTEKSSPGEGFLSDVCQKWEDATEPASERGIRVVMLRIGVVLSLNGGALRKMIVPFKLGFGGVIGSGTQYVSWIAIDDVIGIILHIMSNDSISGPVNATAPNPVTNRVLTKTLGRVLRRPTLFPLPAFIAKWIMGEMAEALLLSSTRVTPQSLDTSGYSFLYPELEGALRHILGK